MPSASEIVLALLIALPNTVLVIVAMMFMLKRSLERILQAHLVQAEERAKARVALELAAAQGVRPTRSDGCIALSTLLYRARQPIHDLARVATLPHPSVARLHAIWEELMAGMPHYVSFFPETTWNKIHEFRRNLTDVMLMLEPLTRREQLEASRGVISGEHRAKLNSLLDRLLELEATVRTDVRQQLLEMTGGLIGAGDSVPGTPSSS